jgi:hypothetical protein
VLEDWSLTSSFDRMPAGLFGLRNALSDDLHDAEELFELRDTLAVDVAETDS